MDFSVENLANTLYVPLKANRRQDPILISVLSEVFEAHAELMVKKGWGGAVANLDSDVGLGVLTNEHQDTYLLSNQRWPWLGVYLENSGE